MKTTVAIPAALAIVLSLASAQPFRLGKRAKVGACNPAVELDSGK